MVFNEHRLVITIVNIDKELGGGVVAIRFTICAMALCVLPIFYHFT